MTDDGPINRLIDEYVRWNAAQGLNLGSADEHIFDENLTAEQRAWLADFGQRWDNATDTERAWADAEAEEFCRPDFEEGVRK